ncbi:hypothetical protein K1719_020984 [Acacia pycnantha]|nr:hypothetical protein K1719_020984 [Acacia pycnantha]
MRATALFVYFDIDTRGFSFEFLEQLRAKYNQKKLPSPVHFHYVAPSFWVWKGGEARLSGLAGFMDHLFCILPNEAEICRLYGLAATFFGHPVIEDVLELNSRNDSSALELRVEGSGEDFHAKHAVPSATLKGATVISVLPERRVQIVTRMLPIFATHCGATERDISTVDDGQKITLLLQFINGLFLLH